MQDIVYDVTTLNIKPNFALGTNKLSVPKFKNYDQYMITQQKEIQQQKYFMDNQTLKFGRKQNEVLKDGIWQTQLLGGSQSNNNLLANTGKMLMSQNYQGLRESIDQNHRQQRGGVMQGMSLNDLLPDSWINSKYINNIEKPRFEETFNDRESQIRQSDQSSSQKSQSMRSGNQNNKMSPTNSDLIQGQRQYY